MSEHPPLTLRTLDPRDPDVDPTLLDGWAQALARGFLEGRLDDERRELWLSTVRHDGVLLRGAWAEQRVATAPLPVATYASWPGRVNLGRVPVSAHLISDVTVAPTHRRRGLLRTLMTADLDAAVAAGLPLAALTVSEGSIYGRFGFGPATVYRSVEVDTSARFALHDTIDDTVDGAEHGSLELVEPAEAWPVVERVSADHLSRTRGEVERPHQYEAILTGRFDWEHGGPARKLRGVVHLDAEGTPDGYALWTPKGRVDGVSTADVASLVALTATAHRRLWRFLADLDLVDRVRATLAPHDPLDWIVTDPRVVATTQVRDRLWLRVLDVAAVLTARPWFADGEVVLDVDDPLGHAAGTWRVRADAGTARVERVDPADAAPAVRLGVDVLGSLVLGDVRVGTLAAAGRLTGAPDAVAILARMVDGGPAPFCSSGF